MFASLGAYGHLYPLMPLALACAAAGHETVIAIGPPFLGRLPLPTVPGYPPDLQLDWAIQETRRRHPADQFLNAEILRAADAGRALINDDLQPGAIGQAVQAMLGDCPERQAASRVRDEIASMPAPADVVPALVELAGR